MPKAVAMNTTKWWFACCQVTLGIYYPEILTSLSLSFARKVRNLRSGSVVFLPQRGGSCVSEHWFSGAAIRRICTNGAWQQKPFSKTLQWGGGGAATFRVVWSGNGGFWRQCPFGSSWCQKCWACWPLYGDWPACDLWRGLIENTSSSSSESRWWSWSLAASWGPPGVQSRPKSSRVPALLEGVEVLMLDVRYRCS